MEEQEQKWILNKGSIKAGTLEFQCNKHLLDKKGVTT